MKAKLPTVPARVRFEALRKSVHVTGAILAVFSFVFLPFWFSIAVVVTAITAMTVTHFVRKRKIKVAPPIEMLTDPIGEALDRTRRPGEDFPWAPVLFSGALLFIGVVTIFFGLDKAFAVAAFGILGIGDAASALIGVAYGKHKLPWNKKKSWEGTGAGFVAAFLSAGLLAAVAFGARGEVFPPLWLAIAFAGAFCGALVESVPGVEDNLFVPIVSLGAMLATAAALGLL